MAGTPGPWKFAPMDGYDELHKLRGTKPAPWEGYRRENDGTWTICDSMGTRVASASMKAKAKRGQGYCTPDPEGMANARLIAAAPELLAALDAAPEMDCWPDMTKDELDESLGGYVRWFHDVAIPAIRKAKGE